MRASEAPEQWKEVLTAINRDDYELAHKLAIKYRFATRSNKDAVFYNVRHMPDSGDYVAMDPKGNIYCHEKANVLSEYLGLSFSYVSSAVKRQGGYSRSGAVKGIMKGWRFWREK